MKPPAAPEAWYLRLLAGLLDDVDRQQAEQRDEEPDSLLPNAPIIQNALHGVAPLGGIREPLRCQSGRRFSFEVDRPSGGFPIREKS